MKLCEFFNIISRKVIDPNVLGDLQTDLVKIMCNLEIIFPRSFFDVMAHLIIHIVHEIKMCGSMFLCSVCISSNASWEFFRTMLGIEHAQKAASLKGGLCDRSGLGVLPSLHGAS